MLEIKVKFSRTYVIPAYEVTSREKLKQLAEEKAREQLTQDLLVHGLVDDRQEEFFKVEITIKE